MRLPEVPPRPFPSYNKLYSNLDSRRLPVYAECYDDAITILSRISPKKQNGSEETLLSLDEFRYKTLPGRIASRWNNATLDKCITNKAAVGLPQEVNEGAGWINLDELKQLMEWKLRRGKNRPALRGLIASNSDKEVRLLTKAAIAQHQNRKSGLTPLTSDSKVCALDELKYLRGVGDATASLILSAAFPDDFPFFSDELYTWAVAMENKSQEEFEQWHGESARANDTLKVKRNMPTIKYTKKEYSALCDSITRLQDRLHIHTEASNYKPARNSAEVIDKAAYVIMRYDEILPTFNRGQTEAQLLETQMAEEGEKAVGKKRKRPADPMNGLNSASTAKEKKQKGAPPKAQREMPRRAAKEKASKSASIAVPVLNS